MAFIVPKERVIAEYEELEEHRYKRIDYKRKRSDIKRSRGKNNRDY